MRRKVVLANEIATTNVEKQLILYDHNDWQVILYDGQENKAVLYNVVNKNLAICEGAFFGARNGPLLSVTPHASQPPAPAPMPPSKCPLCHQAMSPKSARKSSTPPVPVSATDLHVDTEDEAMGDQSYRARDYFHLLEYRLEQERKDSQGAKPNSFVNNDPLAADSMNSGYYRRFFIEERKIGSGGFGAVFLCRHIINGVDLGKYAIKKVPVGDNRPWLLKVLREVKALESLKKHPNIVNYQHSWLENDKTADFGPTIPCLFILMEYANGGSLAELISGRNKRVLSEAEIWKYFVDICEGLNHLHTMGIIHRDIKPQNILLNTTTTKDGTDTRALISDFGTCTTKMREPAIKRTGNTGTMEYLAPELLIKDQNGLYNEYFDEKCDIWSLGVMLYEMAFGRLPFMSESSTVDNLIDEIIHFSDVTIPYPHSRSSELVQMVALLLKTNPVDRPNTQEILRSPFIRKLQKRRDPSHRFHDIPSPMQSDKIVRIPSIGNNMDIMEKSHEIVRSNPALRRSIELPPRNNGSSPKLQLSSFIPERFKQQLSAATSTVIQAFYILLLLTKLCLCLNTCHTAPSPLYIYPLMLASILQILSSNSGKPNCQYLLHVLQWLWVVVLSYTNSLCVHPELVRPEITIHNHTVLVLSLSLTYLTTTFKHDR